MGIINDLITKMHSRDELDACSRLVAKYLPAVSTRGQSSSLMEFARSEQIEIRYSSQSRFEGSISREDFGKPVITIRRGLNKRRERFTLAHELGHYLLQKEMLGTVDQSLYRGLSTNRSELAEEEKLANLIAAEILLPSQVLHADFDAACPLASILKICRSRQVSRVMALRRVADVYGLSLFLIQIVPFMFDDLDSAAEIDDAIFVEGREGTLFDRERTKFTSKFSYRDLLMRIGDTRLEFQSPKGFISADCEMNPRKDPIPHIFAMGRVA